MYSPFVRARWVFLIACGVLVLSLAALFIRPGPGRFMVAVVYDTNAAPTAYTVNVANVARRPHVFWAWSEYQTNGEWIPVTLPMYSKTLKPSEMDTFTLPKPEHSKGRIVVGYNRVSTGQWERWRESLRALVGLYTRGEWMYIDAP